MKIGILLLLISLRGADAAAGSLLGGGDGSLIGGVLGGGGGGILGGVLGGGTGGGILGGVLGGGGILGDLLNGKGILNVVLGGGTGGGSLDLADLLEAVGDLDGLLDILNILSVDGTAEGLRKSLLGIKTADQLGKRFLELAGGDLTLDDFGLGDAAALQALLDLLLGAIAGAAVEALFIVINLAVSVVNPEILLDGLLRGNVVGSLLNGLLGAKGLVGGILQGVLGGVSKTVSIVVSTATKTIFNQVQGAGFDLGKQIKLKYSKETDDYEVKCTSLEATKTNCEGSTTIHYKCGCKDYVKICSASVLLTKDPKVLCFTCFDEKAAGCDSTNDFKNKAEP